MKPSAKAPCVRVLEGGIEQVNGAKPFVRRLGGVDLLSWNPPQLVEGDIGVRLINNFGDLLGPLLVERIAGATAMRRELADGVASKVLLGVGSIVHFAPPQAVVWGSGVNFKLQSPVPRDAHSLDIRAVRGPHSARALISAGASVPRVYGDPALLLPRYLPELHEWRRSARGGITVVPNLNDFCAQSAVAESNGYQVVNPRGPLMRVLRSIAESDMVVGSSLHAVVIADALGIPARFVASDSEGPWKYYDYLAGTGRPLTKIAPDVASAIDAGPHEEVDADLDSLLDAFPYDLWSSMPRPTRPSNCNNRAAISVSMELCPPSGTSDSIDPEERFAREIFPDVLQAGMASVEDLEKFNIESVERDFGQRFHDAHAYRLAFAPGISASDLREQQAPLLEAFDDGDATRFLRQIWLEREGPHALFRSVVRAGSSRVFSIVLRPGGLTNTITDIEVLVLDSRQWQVAATVPVFAMYKKQWSIDLTFSIHSEESFRGMRIRVTTEQETTIIPMLVASNEHVSLKRFASIASASLWQEEEEPESSDDRVVESYS